jgi:hypothetical protein
MSQKTYLYDIKTIPKSAEPGKRPRKSVQHNNQIQDDIGAGIAQNIPHYSREVISTPASTVSKAPSMTMASHRRSIYRKSYNRKEAIPNVIYNSNFRERVCTKYPLTSMTINRVG